MGTKERGKSALDVVRGGSRSQAWRRLRKPGERISEALGTGSGRISTAARLELLPAPARARVVATDAPGFRTDGPGAGMTLRLRIGDVGRHPCGPTGTNDEGGDFGLLPRSDPLEVE